MSALAALTARVAAADDEVFRVQMADDFCMTNGAYDRACAVARAARRDLIEAQLQEIERLGSAICATSRDIVATLNGELA